jgi:diguanylate cyclase (GGDEF)-like protein
MARSAGVLFAAGAALSLLAMIVPHGPDVDELPAVVTSLLAFPIAAALLLGADRVPRWLIHVLMVCGIAMVAVGVYTAGKGRIAGSASVFYLWIAFYVAYFFSLRTAAGYVVLVALSYAAVLAIEHEAAGPALWAGMTGTVTATALVMSSLSGRLRALACTDALTGLPNRRGWEASLERELARAARKRTPLCVALLDLDNFKMLNDDQGHLAGDRILKVVAATWLGLLRDSDVLARYGGDEFGVILPDCPPPKAAEIVARLSTANPEGAACSVGVACAQRTDDAHALIGRADRALYEAKAAGGRQVVTEAAFDSR